MAGARTRRVRYWDHVAAVRRGARCSALLLQPRSPPHTRLCVCNRSHFVYMYHHHGSLQVVYRLPSAVWQVEVHRSGERLFVLCDDGGIYNILLNQKSSAVKAELSLNPSQSRGDSGCFVPPVITVGIEQCLVRDSTVCSFIAVHEQVVMVTEEERKWKIKIFGLPSADCQGQKCQKIEEIELTSHANLQLGEKSPKLSHPPVLCCIYPHAENEQQGSEDYPCLQSSVFSLLFNVDASLLRSPVVLCGLPDGQVCFLPVKYTRPEAKGHSSRTTVLLHLEQPVAFIGPLSLKLETDDDQDRQSSRAKPPVPNSIVVVGRDGKVVIVKSSLQMEMWAPSFVEYHLQGPIVGACCHAATLYYSTCSDVFGVEFQRGENSSSGRTADMRSGHPVGDLPSILIPVSLNICGVVAVSRPSLTAEGDIQLVALTEKGKVMACTLPPSLREAPTTKLHAATAGQRIKDHLSGISSVSDRIASLKGVMQQKDKALKGLNQVFNICCALLAGQEKGTEPSEQPFRCQIAAKWNRVLLQDSLVISCILENLSNWPLEHGWSFCVQLVTQSLALAKGLDSTAYTSAFAIGELPPREKMEVAIPLNSEHDGSLPLPVAVHCFLHYDLNHLRARTASSLPASPGPSQSPVPAGHDDICLPLNSRIVDLLDCLHIHSGGASETRPHLNHRPAPPDPLEIFLHSALKSNNVVNGNGSMSGLFKDRTGGGPFTASIKLSSHLMDVALKDTGTGNEAENGSNVLQWLLSTNAEMEALRMQLGPGVHCSAPDGSSVHILTKKVEVTNFSVDGAISAVEVVMECSSLSVFCFLHQALTRRVQMLLEQSAPHSGSMPGLHVQSLRQLAHSTEGLLKEVQSLRDQRCLGEEMNPSDTASKLLRLYERLRSIDLVIV
ncbi:Fanconi anemia core complex-associated protein 100 [Leucoraja erinacea]|uniref:Fanconi anemia core complex-associated protein 100 n=1 Tax=Leucoraja erinaceus TaxID=7782 RepID=UPI00245864D2|nr:Fanconi anemia core complex-associated protein 100 [Leucoraja erinacea]